jgi:hypothetical protein
MNCNFSCGWLFIVVAYLQITWSARDGLTMMHVLTARLQTKIALTSSTIAASRIRYGAACEHGLV